MEVPPSHPPIIHETKHWIAINKPAGMAVEGSKVGSPTVQSQLYDYLAQTEKKPYIGTIHRLDRVTTGILLVAKKKSVLKLFNEIFRERKIQKTYLALSDKEPVQAEAQLTHHLVQDRDLRKAILFDQPQKDSKICRLRYKLLANSDMGYHLFQVALLTGKYHQIRAQLSTINCPIIGDEKYNSKAAYYKREIGLHAWQLQFTDPITQTPIQMNASPPRNPFWNDFSKIISIS